MSLRTKRFAAVLVLALGVGAQGGTAFAGRNHGPVCHGTNQVTCRPDPQPTHGNDCGSNTKHPLNSSDHCMPLVEIPL
jgi:hypothetical protein